MGPSDPIVTAVLQGRMGAIAGGDGRGDVADKLLADPQLVSGFLDRLGGWGGTPGGPGGPHPGACGRHAPAARAVAAAFADAKPGDVFLLNDPYHGGSHLPDVTAVAPVFGEGALRFWSVVRAHQSDIGGRRMRI